MEITLSWIIKSLIRLYQICISPFLGANCRFHPSCSQYTREAVELHGPVKGLWLGMKRIVRCGPWNQGGYDPVPPPAHSSAERETLTGN
ncbi:MAG: membrane protein insertion efficiency factor YidD [Deltaproteobacteria bacterium]|nr:MAG: membrane protein insertion efficiency factor YidD [Deltaproteobacteria bacterium]